MTLYYRYGFLMFTLLLFLACASQPVQLPPPGDAQALFQKAQAYLQSGQTETARFYFQKALQTDSAHADAWLGLVTVSLQNHQTAQARHYLEEALKREPDLTAALLIRARISYQQGDCDHAIADLNKILQNLRKGNTEVRLDGNLEEVAYLLGRCYQKTGQYEQAMTALDLAIRENPNNQSYPALRMSLRESEEALTDRSARLREIVDLPGINRQQLAIVLYEYIKDVLPQENISPPLIPDVPAGHSDIRMINFAIRYNLLPLFPDGRFHPEHVVRRGEMALLLNRMGRPAQAGDASLITVRDVGAKDYIYHAVQYVLRKKLMETDPNGAFDPYRELSGLDAVLAVYRLKTEIEN